MMPSLPLATSQQPASHLPSRAVTAQENSTTQSGVIALIIACAIAISAAFFLRCKNYRHYRYRQQIKTLERTQIPCQNCQFFKNNPHLKCAVHPAIVLTQQAIDCQDYKPLN